MDFETPYTFMMQIWSGIASDIIQLATAALVFTHIVFKKNPVCSRGGKPSTAFKQLAL